MIIVFILNTAFPSSLPTWFFVDNNLIAFAWFSLCIFPYSFIFSYFASLCFLVLSLIKRQVLRIYTSDDY